MPDPALEELLTYILEGFEKLDLSLVADYTLPIQTLWFKKEIEVAS